MSGLSFNINNNHEEPKINTTTAKEEPIDIDKDTLSEQLQLYYYKQYKKTNDINYLSQALITLKDGTPVENHRIQKEILYFLERNQGKNMLVECCVNAGKTEQVCMFYASRMYENKRKNSFVVSQNESTAGTRLSRIRFYLDRLAKLDNKAVNYKKDSQLIFNLEGNLQKDPTCSAYGFAGGYNGLRVDYLIADDIETQGNLPELYNNKEIFYNVFIDRKDAGSTITVINTPFHTNGIVKEIEKKQGWSCLMIGLSPKLIIEDKYDELLNDIKKIDDIIIRTKLFEMVEYKNLYGAIDFLKKSSYNKKDELIIQIYNTLDFRFIKRELIDGHKVVEDEIIEEWDYFKFEKGKDILDKYVTNYKSYLLSYALDTDTATRGEIFTHHENARIQMVDFIKATKDKKVYKFFSYDLAGEGRNGTIITEWELKSKDEAYVPRQTKHDTIDAVKESILKNLGKIHVIEVNSQQKTVVKLLRDMLPEAFKWTIIEHYTLKQTLEDSTRGIVTLEEKFYNKKIQLVEQGLGIPNLSNKLTSYKGVKTKKEQNDEVMSLWIGAFNIPRVITTYQIKEQELSNPTKKRKEKFRVV